MSDSDANPPSSIRLSPRTLELPALDPPLPASAWGRCFSSGGRLDQPATAERDYPWYKVMCLTGVDYFSSLAYQTGIALLVAGLLAPTATLVLVVVTLFAALPVYAVVAGRSFVGQGSIAMLENLLAGWKSKIFVLILIGFATTDFVITMTLSAADAARHLVANPYLHPYLSRGQFWVTALLLLILAAVFFIGFREAIALAVATVVPFLALNLVVLVAGLTDVLRHPATITAWRFGMRAGAPHGSLAGVVLLSVLVCPKLALGLSGFETGVSVMPLVRGAAGDAGQKVPAGRIRNTRKLLVLAALIMAFYLILSSFVTTLLIPPAAYAADGPAAGRAVSYLAHRLLGSGFGTLFDLSTILILWFAGASAMAGLINLVPRYLPRFGMAPRWVAYRRPMVAVLLAADLLVTIAFRANVEKQAGAYATGVLVLILSAAVAAAIVLWREYLRERGGRSFAVAALFVLAALAFVYMLAANVIERPDGVIISSVFIVVILTFSAISRYQRAKELRVAGMDFADDASADLWPTLVGKKVNLVPCHTATAAYRQAKTVEIGARFRISRPLAFVHVNLLDNRSEFISRLRVGVQKEQDHYLIEIWGAVAVPNTIACLSELMDPAGLFIMLSGRNLMEQSLRYLLWGEGEIGLLVYSILVRYWEREGRKADRPTLFLTTA